MCAACGSLESDWVQLPGTGTLRAHVVFHKAYSPVLEPDLPYAVGLIQLDDGPLYVSRLLDAPPSSWRAGQRVRVTFDMVVDGWRLPCFVPTPKEERDGHN
jgi:uncharacterized OB-fold protein